jgi:hypothetical protein
MESFGELDLTQERREALTALRAAIESDLGTILDVDDTDIVRFLAARKWEVDRAHKLWKGYRVCVRFFFFFFFFFFSSFFLVAPPFEIDLSKLWFLKTIMNLPGSGRQHGASLPRHWVRGRAVRARDGQVHPRRRGARRRGAAR